MNPGKLIALEGVDGTGKSTQAVRLVAALRRGGVDVLATREPTDGPVGSEIRKNALAGTDMSAEQELHLFLEDRKQHIEQVVAPALAAGRWVVSDRYYLSNVAYQGARGLDPEAILAENEALFPAPDLALVFELDVEAGMQRIASRGGPAEPAFEEREFLARVDAVYRGLERPYIARIDASGDADCVHARVLAAVRSALGVL